MRQARLLERRQVYVATSKGLKMADVDSAAFRPLCINAFNCHIVP